MFFLVGVLYDRAHTRMLDNFGGLYAILPVYGSILISYLDGFAGSSRVERFCLRIHDRAGRLADLYGVYSHQHDRAAIHRCVCAQGAQTGAAWSVE